MKLNLHSTLSFTKQIILKIILFLKKGNAVSDFIFSWVLGYKYQSLKFIEFEKYLQAKPEKALKLFSIPIVSSYCPPRYKADNSTIPKMKHVEYFNNYAAIFKDVEVIGGSNVIIADDLFAIYDLKTYDLEQKMYYSDQGIRTYHKDFLLVKKYESTLSIDTAIFLGGNYSWNYFHFLYEIVVKFFRIEYQEIDPSVPFIIDSSTLNTPQFLELFSFFNHTNRKLITLDKGKRCHVHQMYYFSCPNIIPPDLIDPNSAKSYDVLLELKSLDFLRRNLISHASKNTFSRRIFISRSKASGRRAFNEEAVFERFKKYNFSLAYPEDLSLSDQISLFNGAEYIVGGAGAAFTNLIFCNSHCKVLTFAKTNSPFSGFSTIANFVGVEFILYTNQNSDKSKVKGSHDSFNVNVSQLDIFLSQWIV